MLAGAVWAWDDAKALVADCHLHADKTYVVLTDGNATADIKASSFSTSCAPCMIMHCGHIGMLLS